MNVIRNKSAPKIRIASVLATLGLLTSSIAWSPANAQQTIVGLLWNGTNEEIRTVAAPSGTSALVSTLPGIGLVIPAANAVDPIAGRLYQLGYDTPIPGQPRLYEIEPSAGTLLSSVDIDRTFANLRTRSDGVLVGLVWNGTDEELRSLDPLTGTSTLIGTITGLHSVLPSACALDRSTNTLYQVGFSNSSPGQPKLYTIDALTGVVTDVQDADGVASTLRVRSDGVLLGLIKTAAVELRSIDPTTGTSTLLATTTATQVVAAANTMNSSGTQMHLLGFEGFVVQASKLFTLDAFTGATVSDPLSDRTYSNLRLAASQDMIALNDLRQSNDIDEMLRVPDPSTGAAEFVGSLGDNFVNAEAMAVLPARFSNTLSPSALGTAARQTGARRPSPIAARPVSDRIFVADNDRLLELNPLTGDGTLIGAIGFSDVDGISFHPVTGVLYGVTYGANELISINIGTGQGTLVASDVIVGRRLEDLAFHPDGRAFVLTSGPRIYEIDIATGAKLGKWVLSGGSSLEALVWSPGGDVLYSAADRGATKDLVTITLANDASETGTISFVSAEPSGFSDIEGLAFISRPLSNALFAGQQATDVTPGAITANRLFQNAPNPFNPMTRISFDLARSGAAELNVYDVAGRRVVNLFRGTLDAGSHEFVWNGRSHRGEPVAAGVYHYTLTVNDETHTKRMTLIK